MMEVNFWVQLVLAFGVAWFLYFLGKAVYVKCGGDSGSSKPLISLKVGRKK